MITPPAQVIVHIIPTPKNPKRRPNRDKLENNGFQVLKVHTMPSPPGLNITPAREHSYGGIYKEPVQMVNIGRLTPAPKI